MDSNPDPSTYHPADLFWRDGMYMDRYGWKYWNQHLNCWTWVDSNDEEYVYLYDVDRRLLPHQIQQRQQTTPRWTPTYISYFKFNHRQFENWAFPPERYR